VKSNGSLGETWIEDSSGESVSIYLWAQWENKVTGQHMDNGMVVQNYAQWTSTTEAGKFDGFTCAATYEKSNGTTSNVTVRNIANSDSLTNADGKQNGKAWSAIGTAATEYEWFEKETEPSLTNEFYGRTYLKNKESIQRCGAVGMMFYQEGGEDVSGLEQLNEAYWQIKNAGAITMSTGFRIFDGSDVWAYGDAEQVSWSANDWGLEDPNAQVIVPDDLDETSDSGAASLAMATVTALTAFLMF